MKLILAEKPDVMRQLVQAIEPSAKMVRKEKQANYYKGENFVFISSLGHIIDLKYPAEINEDYKMWKEENFPYNLPNPLPLKVASDKYDYYRTICNVFKEYNFDEIIIATDADREGQGIFERIKEVCPVYPKNITENRMWLSEWTKEGILKSFNTRFPNAQKENLKNAAMLRATYDYLVGLNCTGLCTCIYGGFKNVVNIGRVQTAVGKIIIDRENQIVNFKPVDYTDLQMVIQAQEEEVVLKHKPKKEKLPPSEAIEIYNKLQSSPQMATLSIENKAKTKTQNLLFDALDVQKTMNKLYGYSAGDTSKYMQNLYQNHKLITYIGTKAHHISRSTAKDAFKAIQNLRNCHALGEDILGYIQKIETNNWTIADHCITDKSLAHEAITPVFGSITPSTIDKLSREEFNTYKVIVKSYIQAFFPVAKFNTTKITSTIAEEVFETKGEILAQAGFLEVTGTSKDKLLPPLENGQSYPIKQFDKVEKQTTPPSRFTDATILDAMKNAGRYVEDKKYSKILSDEEIEGIGTGRTRSAILEGMKKHGYYTVESKKIAPTEKLTKLFEVLPDNISITSPVATAKLEEALQHVEDGKLPAATFNKNIYEDVHTIISEIKKNAKTNRHVVVNNVTKITCGTCPDCGKPLVEKKGKYGKFIGCSDYPTCKYIKKETPPASNGTCPNCGKPLIKRKGKYGTFFGCSNYPTCTYMKTDLKNSKKTSSSKSTKSTKSTKNTKSSKSCPKCGKPMIERKGQYGAFYGCSNYPTCKHIEQMKS